MESIPSRVIIQEISEKDNDKYCVIVDDNSNKKAKGLTQNLEVIEISTEQEGEDFCVILDNDVDKPVKELTRCLDILYISSEEEDDDYCVILECNPDDPVKVVSNDSENGSDDLLIVAEKGQVACRDYPHARHLCSKYSWSTDPHKKYCDLCHCFVCDIRAPCAHWGSGSFCNDHCHANDKEERWRMQRKLVQTKSLQSN